MQRKKLPETAKPGYTYLKKEDNRSADGKSREKGNIRLFSYLGFAEKETAA